MVQRIVTTITIGLLLVLASCSITVEQTTLDFGSAGMSKTFEITIEGILKWKIQCDEDWVTLSPDHGQTTQTVTVTVDRTGLDPGEYEALVTIVNNWNIPPTEVLIKMSVEEPLSFVEGYVYDNNTNDLLAGVVVSIGADSYTTNETGYFILEVGSPNVITIAAAKGDYENYSAVVDAVNGTVQHDIYMVPLEIITTTTSTIRPPTTTVPATTTTTAPATTTTTAPSTTTTTAPSTTTTTAPATTTTTAPATTTTTAPATTTTVPVTLTQETVFYPFSEEGGATVKMSICLDNPNDLVGGVQFNVCEYNVDDDPIDCMECIDCELTNRTSTMFDCSILEHSNGCCNVLLFCKSPGCAIDPGICDIVTLVYTTLPLSTECPGTDCITHMPENIVVSDNDGNPLTADGFPGDACPLVCGDVCPPDDPLIDGWDCGDGVVDIYDIMCALDLALTAVVPDDCQLPRADVPTGTPPICVDPDGEINILDIMVITDMALNRPDCCTFYYTGVIF
jgi:hypothetical protein